MSGGSFDYFYMKLEEVADEIYKERSNEEKEVAELCRDLAGVLHDLEWYRSGDIGIEDFKNSWTNFKNKWLKKEDNRK